MSSHAPCGRLNASPSQWFGHLNVGNRPSIAFHGDIGVPRARLTRLPHALTQGSAAPSGRGLAAPADALARPGARKRSLADEALAGLGDLRARNGFLGRGFAAVRALTQSLVVEAPQFVGHRYALLKQRQRFPGRPVLPWFPAKKGNEAAPGVHSQESRWLEWLKAFEAQSARESQETPARDMDMRREGIKKPIDGILSKFAGIGLS
jgi:hypothetical protein